MNELRRAETHLAECREAEKQAARWLEEARANTKAATDRYRELQDAAFDLVEARANTNAAEAALKELEN